MGRGSWRTEILVLVVWGSPATSSPTDRTVVTPDLDVLP